MASLVFVLLMLAASALLVGITVTLGVWMRGVSAVVFPGAGLLVATPLILVLLLIAEAAVVTSAAFMLRYMPLGRVFSWVSHE